jgi:hypothetical protein
VKEEPVDILVAATFGIPATVGLATGCYGWRAGAATAAAIAVVICAGVFAGVFAYGALPITDCPDCTRYAVFLPLAWVFVLMISGGWIVAIAAATAGFAAGRWARRATP